MRRHNGNRLGRSWVTSLGGISFWLLCGIHAFADGVPNPYFGEWIHVGTGDLLLLREHEAWLSFAPPVGAHVNGRASMGECALGGGKICIEGGSSFGCSFMYTLSADVLNLQFRALTDTKFGVADCNAIAGDYRRGD